MREVIQSWISPKVEIKSSETEGKGMFAKENILKGEKVVVLGGLYTDKAEAEKEKGKGKGKLIMQWGADLFSVEDRGDDATYFVNHSCDSNLWMEGPHTLVARRNIKAGEELTADYALWEADESFVSKWTCKCGSKLCRRHVKGTDRKSKTVQDLYKNHFSPLINNRIKNTG